MHHLLTRQLKRIGLLSDTIPSSLEAWQKFLERVSQSYVESDQGYELLERSLALSSQEMQALNEQLRRTSETQLADERDKLHTVIRSVGDGLCVVDQNWKIQLLNPEGQRLWAVREEEVVGRSLDHIITLTSQQDGREHNVMDAIFQETTAGRAVRSDDGQLTTTTGRSFPVSYVLAPIVRDSRSAGAVLVFRDTTDRKLLDDLRRQTEALLRRQQFSLLSLARSTVIQSGLLEEALPEITQATSEALQISRSSIWLLSPDAQSILCKDLYDAQTGTHSAGIELHATMAPQYFRELLTEQTIDATDAQADPRTQEFADSYLRPLGIGAMLDIPIRFKGKLVGVLCNEHVGPPRPWLLEEQQFGHAVASLISLALEAADRLQAQQALRKSENRTRLILDTALDAVLCMDDRGLIIDWNGRAEEIFGWTRHEAIGRPLDQTIIPFGYRELYRVGLERFLATGEGKVLKKRIEITALRRDGTEFPIELAITALHLDNTYTFTAFVADITERKRAEEALRTSEERLAVTVQGAAVGIWDWDLKTNQMYFSPQWKQQLGYLDAELRNEAEEWKSRIHIEDQPEVLAVVTDCWDGRRDQFEIEHRVRYRDGSYRWILSRGSVIRDAFGVTARMVGIHIDTTDRKRIEEDLRIAKEAAEAASKAKSEFLANMSHEIRTPMNGVLGTTELLLTTELTDKQRRLASTVHRSGKTLLAIVNDILDFSKIEAGKLELEMVDFDLSQLLNEALELFSESARRKHLGLTQHIAAAVPLYLKGDPVRLRQIILNLLSNAIKFTERGGISVTTDLLSDSETGVVLRLAVIDSGIGIPLSAQPRIFDAFAQADGSTTRRYGGTGLGLSIVKQLIALMGGAIALESTPGVGSTFTFTIRLHRQDPSAALIKGFSPQLSLSSHDLMLDRSPAPTPQSPSTRNAEVAGRILLVEDNPVNQEVACGMLELLGYQTRVVENGRHAVAAAAEGEMDVILMDCQMPEMDGFTATDEIRRQAAAAGRRRIPIIALTAHAVQGDRDRCLAAGMDDYLTKPFTERQLREVLSKWVRRAASAEPPGTPVSVAQLQGVAGQPTTSHEEISPALDLKALDSIRALQRPNRPNVLASVLRKYLDNSRESVEALRAAIRSGDPAAVQAIAHRLKSSSAQLGALAVAARCKELEQIGIRKDLVDADRVFEQLQSEYVTVCTTFRNEIAKGDPS